MRKTKTYHTDIWLLEGMNTQEINIEVWEFQHVYDGSFRGHTHRARLFLQSVAKELIGVIQDVQMPELGDVNYVTSKYAGRGCYVTWKELYAVVVLKRSVKQTDMEEDIRKKGMLYVQQQRFGKVRHYVCVHMDMMMMRSRFCFLFKVCEWLFTQCQSVLGQLSVSCVHCANWIMIIIDKL